ncbi:MAG: hypothetical protein RIC14_12095 [Filomicrobium sp.]
MLWGTSEFAGFRAVRVVFVAVAALLVAACSPGEVQLEGKLFELAGLNQTSKRSAAPKMKARSGLVVPPDLQKLPDPNQPVAAAPESDLLAAINDPDRVAVKDRATLEREQAEACKEYELEKMRGNQEADQISGPLGSCRQSVLTAIGNWNKSQ